MAYHSVKHKTHFLVGEKLKCGQQRGRGIHNKPDVSLVTCEACLKKTKVKSVGFKNLAKVASKMVQEPDVAALGRSHGAKLTALRRWVSECGLDVAAQKSRTSQKVVNQWVGGTLTPNTLQYSLLQSAASVARQEKGLKPPQAVAHKARKKQAKALREQKEITTTVGDQKNVVKKKLIPGPDFGPFAKKHMGKTATVAILLERLNSLEKRVLLLEKSAHLGRIDRIGKVGVK